MQPIIATGKSSLYSTEFQKVLKNMSDNEKLSKEQLQYGVADTFPNFIQYNNLCITTYTSNLKQCQVVIVIDQFFENNFFLIEEAHSIGNDLKGENI